MEIEFKIKVDTEKQHDLEMVEDIIFQLQDIQVLLEQKRQVKTRNNNNKKG
jgi:hypothetical protein